MMAFLILRAPSICFNCACCCYCTLKHFMVLPVMWIRILMDPELLPGYGSGIIDLEPDPAKIKAEFFFFLFVLVL